MIYLDYNATTPTDPRVAEAMIPYIRDIHGNPSSSHQAGRQVKAGVKRARNQVANMLGASPGEIVFTSGGSESNNFVLKGLADKFRDRPGRSIIISAVEHPAITEPCRYLEQRGVNIVRIPVGRNGLVDPADVAAAITADTMLISIMHANNEVGTIQPIAEIARAAHEAGVLVHTDAAQSVGKIPVDVNELGVDLLSIAGHKFYAPLGVGALYIREGVELEPLIHGAGHEQGRRAGTEAVPAIVGLGEASEIVSEELHTDAAKRIEQLRDRLHARLEQALGDKLVLNGHPTNRLPNTLNISFVGQIGSQVLESAEGLCASTGAACHLDSVEVSPVLAAMGVPEEVALGTVRLSLGRPTTEQEIDQAAQMLLSVPGL